MGTIITLFVTLLYFPFLLGKETVYDITLHVVVFRSRAILDDFREAYHWLRENTHDRARVMSWRDYGYQIAGMANRTTLVDNNTWNNSHIALVSNAKLKFPNTTLWLLLSMFLLYLAGIGLKISPCLLAFCVCSEVRNILYWWYKNNYIVEK